MSGLNGLRQWLDAHSVQERALLQVTVLVVIVALWNTVLMNRIHAMRTQTDTDLVTMRTQVEVLKLESTQLAEKLGIDPDEQIRIRERGLERRLGELEGKVQDRWSAFIPPSEMAQVLREILPSQGDLQLVELRSLDAEALAQAEGDGDTSVASVFRHGVEIRLRGGYLSTLRYLEAVEALPWRFFWDSLEYEVTEYPLADITFIVHTLSTEESWIGV